jgi:hypothetical protein
MIGGKFAISVALPHTKSPSSTAMILSSASPRSRSCSPPTTRAGTMISARVIGRSESTQISSGSPSPRSAPGHSAATFGPQ